MASTKPVDASLWWDYSFSFLLTELENASLSSDLPPILVKTLKDNHAWFVDTVSCFKPPNENSGEALNSQQVKIGLCENFDFVLESQLLTCKTNQAVLGIMKSCLDEVQSYILVERSLENKDVALDSILHEYFHACLLDSGEANAIKEEVLKLISDGMEVKLINVLQVLFSSDHPEQMDIDLFTLWAEETLIEDNLNSFMKYFLIQSKLNTFFLQGILSGSYNFEKLAVSTEALRSSYQTKVQLLLILIETLDLESLLQMIPFGGDQGMNCPEVESTCKGPADGYRSVLRTFVSAFIASYDISLQLEDKSLKLLLDILCKIYQGEESLCIQFWDHESFIDGPIRCLLCNLEGEFPFRTVELVRLLSSLCEGTWPAECVYNFLDKSVGISSLVEINGSLGEDRSQIVETKLPLHVPGFEGLVIPSKTCGRILRLVSGNTALVRWEYTQSGVLVLLMHLSQELYFDRNDKALLILDLFSGMVTFNTAVCFALMDIGNSSHFQSTGMNGQTESNMRSPSRVSEVALKANIFGFSNGHNDPSSGTWFLSGKLAKMLLIDCEQNDSCCSLTISVLDFTLHLMETGLKNDAVLDLIVFSIQYVLVNHEYWKYKVKHTRWRVTLKVLEVMKNFITSV
ncbi:uncharacterized protein [Pyrus communis]|uniref:uncharacterized protein n=1 Tax=Pyrus communis TaxID=23211 RepID=UPI0035BEC114